MPIQWNKWGNETLIETIEKELPQSTFYWLLISISVAIIWIVYLTYYNSRVLGLILTLILNKFCKYGKFTHVKFGSFTISVLSGKIMFRDVHYITENYSLRIQLGYAIFRWWRPLVAKEITEDLSHSETRLSVYLDTFELHVFNRSGTYSRLEKMFGIDELINPPDDDENKRDSKGDDNSSVKTAGNEQNKWQWRDLIPVIKFEISSGKFIFGNYLVPNTLSVNFGDCHMMYTTKPASTPFDQFMHIVKCKADNIRIMLVPSPKYQGLVDEPPRFMGDGFVMLQSNDVDLYYYHDEPGLVPSYPELVELANGDVIARRTWPCWGMDVKFGKSTDISYGPWADRQREVLWKFFYPAEYQEMETTELPEPGQKRIWKSFDFKMSMQADSTLDVLFTKNKETQAMHMTMAQGSYLEFSIPMITEETGYVSKINGQLMHLDATTSLQFRQLLDWETFEFDIEIKYPRHWNQHQDWKYDFTACKGFVYFIFQHKFFFHDLIEDWSSKARPDIFHFVPYTMHFSVLLKEFELVMLCNEWNWIDCFGQNPENCSIAFCGEMLEMSFSLPFIDYLPPSVPLKFLVRAETVDCRLFLPETNTSRHVVLAIAENMKIVDRDGNVQQEPFSGHFGKWRRVTQKSAGWVDCWTTHVVGINISYKYHPCPPSGEHHPYPGTEPITTPDAEEKLLIPLRLIPLRPLRPKKLKQSTSVEDFDPSEMEADLIEVEVEVGPSILCLYGCLLTNFYNIKENYFGEDQNFTDFADNKADHDRELDKTSEFEHVNVKTSEQKPFDPRQYRPFAVRVQATLHDIQAHLVKNCVSSDPPCPFGHLEKLVFEMDKKYKETQLQVLVSPVVLIAKDNFERPVPHSHLCDGHLSLSGLQIRGHAMFSHQGMPLESETLEYAWMVEVNVGDLTGRLTAPQLQTIVSFLQTFIFLIDDAENTLQRPLPYHTCQHGLDQPECRVEPRNIPRTAALCPTADEIKYRMTRVTVDCLDLYLVEAGSALNVQIFPIRLATCNLHGKNNKAGITAIIPNINFKQFVLSVPVHQTFDNQSDCWLEAGGVCLGPINIDAGMALPDPEYHMVQDRFLKLHDKKTKRLWFLWQPDQVSNARTVWKCACIGGSRFFGSNRNGSRFFQPSDQDFVDSTNACVFRVLKGNVHGDIGYGQSLLHKEQLVFNVATMSLQLTPSKARIRSTRNSMMASDSNILSPDSPQPGTSREYDYKAIPDSKTNVSISDASDRTLTRQSMVSDVTLTQQTSRDSHLADVVNTRPDVLNLDTEPLIKPTPIDESPSKNSDKNSIPSEYMPEDSIPDAYDTDRYVSTPSDAAVTWISGGGGGGTSGSASSLPDLKTVNPLPLKVRGHERTSSYDVPQAIQRKPSSKSTSTTSRSSNGRSSTDSFPLYPGSPTSLAASMRRDSKCSLQSTISRQSNLTSPVLRRLSSQISMQRESSTASMTGSEAFMSATEDLSDTSSYTMMSEHDSHRALSPPYQSLGDISWTSRGDRTMETVFEQTVLHQPPQGAPSSSSESVSSFQSAVSSQQASRPDLRSVYPPERPNLTPQTSSEHEDEVHLTMEDSDTDQEAPGTPTPTSANIIDLHGQINHPITKSPLLMSCYMTHMTQLQCSHWSASPPLPNNKPMEDRDATLKPGQSISIDEVGDGTVTGIPEYAYTKEGFTPHLMVNKKEPKTPPGFHSPMTADQPTKHFFPDSSDEMPGPDPAVLHPAPCKLLSLDLSDMMPHSATDPLGVPPGFGIDSTIQLEDHVSKTTAVVDFKGSVDVMVSPLMLEALQRYVEAVTPVLASLHPSSIVDSLHFQSCTSVKAQNKLKQAEEAAGGDGAGTTSGGGGVQGGDSNNKRASVVGEEQESKTSRLQVMFSLSKINICVLQASLVEQMISLSALEHVRELTCVSVLAICLDSLNCQLLINNHSQKTQEAITDSSPDSVSRKNIDYKKAESEDNEATEQQKEDMVGNLHIARIHGQLRRMKRNSNYSEKVFLTAIPEYRSKVLFTFQKQDYPLTDRSSTPSRTSKLDVAEDQSEPEDIAGFIMFECGLEDITLKAATRSGYDGNPNSRDEENLQQIDRILQDIKHRTQIEEFNTDSASMGSRKRYSKVSSDSQGANMSSTGKSETKSDTTSRNTCHSADDEASETQSKRNSTSSSESDMVDEEEVAAQSLQGNASSSVLEFKKVWFNFAAPPPSPKKKKLEFTRLDWNLLSTATPAINAWMNPSHRATVAAKTLVRKLNQRISTCMACIMTEALEMQGIHMPVKRKYTKITSLSRTLQEDPSCQLLTVLRRYIARVGVTVVEENLCADTTPHILTIQKGLLALTRQWKNVLYMPILADAGYHRKKKVPYTVTFAIPKDESIDNFQEEDGDLTMDNFEVVDEKTSLLNRDDGGGGGSVPSFSLGPSLERPASVIGGGADLASPDAGGAKRGAELASPEGGGSKKFIIPDTPRERKHSAGSRPKPRSTTNLPMTGESPSRQASQKSLNVPTPRGTGPGGIRRNESNVSFHESAGTPSLSSMEFGGPSLPGTPMRQSLTRHLNELDKREDEDLYRWMQRQQEYTKLCDHPNLHYYPSVGQESLMGGAGGTSEYTGSQDDALSIHRLATMTQSAFQMADAQVLFKPLLSAIGLHLEAVKTSAIMKKFGGNLSIKLILEALRVDIVDSEMNSGDRKARARAKGKRLPKFHIDTGMDTPAFLCDSFTVMIGMKDMVDFEKSKDPESEPGSLQDLRRKSMRAIKFAMDHMEAKPTTTKVNFSVNCHAITQHVNMSLLRLTHQFVTMIENINETRTELKGLSSMDAFRGHRKQDSKGSSTETGTDTDPQDSVPLLDVPLSPDSFDTEVKLPAATRSAEDLRSPLLSQARKSSLERPDQLPLPPSILRHSAENVTKKYERRRQKYTSFQSSPHSMTDSVMIEMNDTSSPALAEKTIVDEIKENTPKCWRTLYHLLDLYSTMPETKTLGRRPSASRLSVIDEEPEKGSQTQSVPGHECRLKDVEDLERTVEYARPNETQAPTNLGGMHTVSRTYTGNTFTQSILIGEHIPLVVFGMAKVKRVKVSAMLSGLKLEADMQNVHASATHRDRVKGVIKRRTSETSATAHVGHTMIVLLEGVPPKMQTVVTMNVAKSQGLYSSFAKKSRQHNSGLLTIGRIDVDIPQHPVVLHGMVARSSKRLSNTLSEFIRPTTKARSYDSTDGFPPQSSASRHSDLSESVHVTMSAPTMPSQQQDTSNSAGTAADTPKTASDEQPQPPPPPPAKPVVIHFKTVLEGLTIGASLLPSLKARYKMGEVTSCGVSGKKARFTVDLPSHSLSFTSKVLPIALANSTPLPESCQSHPLRRKSASRRRSSADSGVTTPSNLPSSASIDLPPVHMHADWRGEDSDPTPSDDLLREEGLGLRPGGYLNAVAEVGQFEHSLTTDLLNHLVFVQKVFMKEVNEVVQKVSGGDQPVSIWGDEGTPPAVTKPLLFSLNFRLKGIQITATTPSSSAVRLDTPEMILLELSNRVTSPSRVEEEGDIAPGDIPKLFVKLQVQLDLALGTLIKNPMFEEAEPEFPHMASFTTKIGLRNALPDEMIPGVGKDQEALLLSVKRPVMFVQPMAFDKAVLVWLNYKNAYEYWTEQRLALNKEVQTASQQVIDALPAMATAAACMMQPGGTTSHDPPPLSTLFLQLTVEDLGICLPMGSFSKGSLGGTGKDIDEPCAAMVLTLEKTSISACSCGSLVSKGRFNGFCLRFANEFAVFADDWKPDKDSDIVMNGMVVPEGTYEVCSRTNQADANDPNSNAKWILNVKWKMQGIDIHFDTNIGKRLSTLGNTLTSFAGEQNMAPSSEQEQEQESDDAIPVTSTSKLDTQRRISTLPDGLPDFVYDTSLDPKTRARLIEQEMNEQAQNVEVLKALGASQTTIESEQRKFEELEAAVFQDFRQDIMKKIKRQSVKATALKDKLGLGYKPANTHTRSKSTSQAAQFMNSTSGTSAKKAKEGSSKQSEPRRLTSMIEDTEPDSLSPTSPGFTPTHQRAQSFDVMQLIKQKEEREKYLQATREAEGMEEENGEAEANGGGYELLDSSSESEKEIDELSISGRLKTRSKTKAASPGATLGGPQQVINQFEPSVDFELDVKVNIDSGKCVLHPKDPKNEADSEIKSHGKKDYRGSPKSERKKSGSKKSSYEMNTSRSFTLHHPNTENLTIFFMPGVDIKIHYSSKTDSKEERSAESPTGINPPPPPRPVTPDPNDPQAATGFAWTLKKAEKKANLYAWLSLQQLSEEMLISPNLLDFLEQALEPIPLLAMNSTRTASQKPTDSSLLSDDPDSSSSPTDPSSTTTAPGPQRGADMDMSTASVATMGGGMAASFPVDWVVYLRVQPSLVRFTCLPVSRVECLLRLPSLDVTFSTKRGDPDANSEGTPPTKAKLPKRGSSTGSLSFARAGSGSQRLRHASGLQDPASSTATFLPSAGGGGHSVTACMADFSLYIFHPYGGGQKKTSLSALENSFRRGGLGSINEGNFASPLSDIGRKDSLSLNVEFIKVNISRTRKGVLQGELQESKTGVRAANIVRFSAVCDIGSASFKYDMRRLSEILALPRAWYRRSLARRMFLGEETAHFNDNSGSEEESEEDIPVTPESPVLPSRPPGGSTNQSAGSRQTHRRVPSTDNKAEQKPGTTSAAGQQVPGSVSDPPTIPGIVLPPSSPSFGLGPRFNDSDSQARYGAERLSNRFKQEPLGGAPKQTSATSTSIRDWETLVLFAVNLSRLDVMVNMSNVMGNTVWSTTELKSTGQLSIDSSGYRNMTIQAGLGRSKLEARGGIVGGNIEIQQLDNIVSVSEDPGCDPDHSACLGLGIMEARLDYMGSSVLMGRLSDLQVKLGDEWKIDDSRGETLSREELHPLATTRPALIFVHGDLSWDKFHLMISRSTTPDIVKMASKLDEFFTQQFNSSKRVLSAFGPGGGTKSRVKRKNSEEGQASWISEIRHHRHWQSVLEHISGCTFSMLTFALPESGTILGGSMTLHGNNLSLACFHGINFRSKSWALFTLDQPLITFATEAMDIVSDDGGKGTHVVQNLSFELGQRVRMDKKPKAYVCKLSRGHIVPQPFTSVTEWFHYAFANSGIKDLDSFPQMARQGSESPTDRRSTSRRSTEYTHETEIIFVMPPLQMHLKTEHLQGENEPMEDDPKPKVDCTFVTDFDDHIFVAMDAEVILFLHDLVTNYVKEKDRWGASEKGLKSPETEKKNIQNPTSVLKQDFREFDCKNWHLEPTVRLLSWAGKKIDPVGVDYILSKLGFQHARLTIPKWMQRGCMDPLDKVLSVLVDKLILALREEKHKQREQEGASVQ